MPVYGFLEGDTIGLLVLADENETVSQLARKLQSAARLRAEVAEPFVVLHNDKVLRPDVTVAAAGIGALDRVDVRRKKT